MPILFLSHSGSDTEAARALKRRIEGSPAAMEAGLKVWFDKDDLRAGKSWQAQLAATIEKEADAFAVLLGARGVVNWVEAEVEVALSRVTKSPEFPFIPIIAKESEGSNALPAFARRFHRVLDPLNDSGELAKLIKAATGDWDRRVILTDEPFVGLRAMDESWANRFFGRKAEVRELVEKFKKHRLIAIVADSGAGKSSLAQAGLIPAFRGGTLAEESRDEPEDKIWHVIVMRPGSDPVQGLKDGLTDAAKLLGVNGAEQSQLRGRLNISDVGESAYVLRCDLDRKTTETLLIIDQFEELLIQTPEEKQAPFVDFLCALADGPFGFRILLTLRADYFNFDDSLRKLRSRLWADRQDAVIRLRRMSDQALADTAREPLALVGFRDQVAVNALIRAIQRDVSDREGDLALVQMALHSVWRRHKAQSEDLLQAYAEVQGVSGALAYEAEKVHSKLNDAQKALLFPILARLIRRGELGGATRRMARRDEFDAEKQRLIAHLSSEEGGRLLLAGVDSVEIAHEALITRWPWLRTEGQKYAPDIEELSRLMDKAKAWAKESVDNRPKYLATGAELEGFCALAERRKNWLSSNEVEFITASAKATDFFFAQSQASKMQAIGQLAGGVAHDFNNVLTAIIGYSDLLLANHRPTDQAFRDINQIKQNANRAASLVRQLLAFSRRQTLRPQVLQLGDVLSDLQMLMRRLVGEKIDLELRHGRELWLVEADVNQFEHVLVNLIVNARDAMPDGGKIILRTRNVAAAECTGFNETSLVPAEYVAIEVEDFGCGIAPEVKDKIFEPFFTTKEVGKGTGLGLAMVYGIVKQTGGYVFFSSTLGKGTVFTILLPRSISDESHAFQPAGKEVAMSSDLTGHGTILLVEDEEAVRAFGARALASRGYTVLQAASGIEALQIVEQNGGKIDLIVSNVVMPNMDGPTMFGELRKRGVRAKVIFVSGYAEDAFAKNLPDGEDFGFLPKPFSLKQLIEAVNGELARFV